MEIELKGFQELAVAEVLTQMRAARTEADRYSQTILLSAPTGAGKTVIATAVIESLMEGDDSSAGTEPTILWITDQPELNEQTKRKMQQASNILKDSRLITIENNFDDAMLHPGRVYFLNTQKLGRNSSLVNPGDRNRNLWNTIRESVTKRPKDFWVIIDEAHRGMADSAADRDQAQTIIQRFIKGDENLPPVPMIFGISATPERFISMITGSRRALRPPVEVTAEEVRISGLLKQTLLVYHPNHSQPSDYTLLRAAAERLGEYQQSWANYETRTSSAEFVAPMLVVQVENAPSGTRREVTQTDLQMAISVIESTVGPLSEQDIGHSFQEQIAIPIGDGRILNYVAPSDIQSNTNLRVVFFKTALSTGWDCPRAETIMSFRKATDHTNIAQLVGRMVRTPLARTIEDDEFLNTVSLYLPHYDRQGLDRVLGRLQADDPEFLPPIDVKPGDQRVSLQQAAGKDECFNVLADLPTYDVVRVRAVSNLRRLIKLARLLDRDTITTDEMVRANLAVVELLSGERSNLEQTDWWREIVKESGTIDLRTVEWALGHGLTSETQIFVPITQQNVEDLFAAAGRRFGEGLHKVYWKHRAEEDSSPRMIARIAKLEAFALSQNAGVEKALEQFAETAVAAMLAEHGAAIRALPPDRADSYRIVRVTAKDPQPRPLGLFERIEGQSEGPAWNDHLYVDELGTFHCLFTSLWEPAVLEAAMEEDEFVGWLRLVDRKDWALTVPYEIGSEIKPLYPDFLTFRRERGRVVADILDPHDPTREDWVPKVKGLSRYAAKHWNSYGRIEASFIDRQKIHRLNLAVERNREQALQAEGVNALRDLFVPD